MLFCLVSERISDRFARMVSLKGWLTVLRLARSDNDAWRQVAHNQCAVHSKWLHTCRNIDMTEQRSRVGAHLFAAERDQTKYSKRGGRSSGRSDATKAGANSLRQNINF